MKKPRLPAYFHVLTEPAGESGETFLYFVSQRRRIKVQTDRAREFHERVIPLLDGRHTVAEIEANLAGVLTSQELKQGLELLSAQHILQDSGETQLPPELSSRLESQLNFFHELGLDAARAQQKLTDSQVAVIGMGGPGATAALSLAAAQVGAIRCFDALPIAAADPYLNCLFSAEDIGSLRVDAVCRRIQALSKKTKVSAQADALETEDSIFRAIEGCDFVICCVDPGLSAVIYRLNRVCLQAGIPWTSCVVSGFEGVLGPTIHPHETACYMCYSMRAVACADNPDEAFSYLRFLDRRKQDDSGTRENLVFGSGIMGNMIALEALKQLTGFSPPSALGQLIVVDFLQLTLQKHMVLRKPWCPVCFGNKRT